MKIWEKIVENEKSKFINTKDDVCDFMYENRIYPCQYEEYEFNRKTLINDMCNKNKGNGVCSECLSEYLTIEID